MSLACESIRCTLLTETLFSSGVVGAQKGTLAIMVGGDPSTFAKAEPILQSMASKVTLCGDLGAGLAAKIANKFVESSLYTCQCRAIG